MTLLSNTVTIRTLDESGSDGLIKFNLPTSVSEAAALAFSDAFSDLCQAAMAGGIQEASVTLSVDISALGLKTVAAALSDTAEKFYMGFRSAIGSFAKIFVPTIDETMLLPDGTADPAATDLTDWMTANLSGIELADSTIVQPCDRYGSDLTSITGAKELFKKKGKPRQ